MAEAWRRAADVATGALWIVAQAQTAGRGRRGRAWVSEPGNLYATLLLRDAGTTSRLGELSFIAALALHGAVEKATSASQGRSLGARLTLKWPNDLLLDGAKLAGVLIEAESRGASSAVAIGVGVNCAHSPEADYPVTSLAAQGLDVPPEAVMTALAGEMKRWLGLWDRGAGFEAVRAAWLERARGLGEPILVRLPHTTLEGVFQSLDERGQLLLRGAGGAITPIAAGEVFLMQGRDTHE